MPRDGVLPAWEHTPVYGGEDVPEKRWFLAPRGNGGDARAGDAPWEQDGASRSEARQRAAALSVLGGDGVRMSAGELAKRGSEAGGLWDVAAGNADADEQRRHEGDSDVHPPGARAVQLGEARREFLRVGGHLRVGADDLGGVVLRATRRGRVVRAGDHVGVPRGARRVDQDIVGDVCAAVRFFAGADTAVPAQVLAREAVAEVSEHDRRAQRVGESVRRGERVVRGLLCGLDRRLHVASYLRRYFTVMPSVSLLGARKPPYHRQMTMRYSRSHPLLG